jgi:hypothetical protein
VLLRDGLIENVGSNLNMITDPREMGSTGPLVVYLMEKSRLPPSAYEQLTQALADPEHVLPKPFSPPPSCKPCDRFYELRCRTYQTAS